MTDEETKAMLINVMATARTAMTNIKNGFLGLSRKRQIMVMAIASIVMMLVVWGIWPVEDYSDPVDFFEKVARDEMLKRADFYNEYNVKRIDVVSACIRRVDGDSEEVTAELRFVPKSGTRYYRWENWFTAELPWLGVFPGEPFDKMFAAEIRDANRVAKEWNAYKVGIFRQISDVDKERMLNYGCRVTRRRVDGIYVAETGGWEPFCSLDFNYYHTQYTADKRDDCPALLCDSKGPEDEKGRRFEQAYRKAFADFIKVRDELDEACRTVRKNDDGSIMRLRNALKEFVKTVGAVPKLDK